MRTLYQAAYKTKHHPGLRRADFHYEAVKCFLEYLAYLGVEPDMGSIRSRFIKSNDNRVWTFALVIKGQVMIHLIYGV